jgi:seryl-tRNA synthetase
MSTPLSRLSGHRQAQRRALIARLRSAENVLTKRLESVDKALEAAAEAEEALNGVIEAANVWISEAFSEYEDKLVVAGEQEDDAAVEELERNQEAFSDELSEVSLNLPDLLDDEVPTVSADFAAIGSDE